MILRLAPENTLTLWPKISELIRPAVSLVSTHSVADILRAVVTMKAQLWVELRDDKPIAAVVTEFVDYPAGLFVRCWLAGADRDYPMNLDGFMEALDKWRLASGAIGFEAIGRHGWMRKFPDAQIEGVIMRYVV